jgi:hypothetical protein
LAPGKPADFGPPELDSLAQAIIGGAGPAVSVGIAEQRASTPPPDEVLHALLQLGEGYLAGKFLDIILGWARERWRERREEATTQGEEPTPIYVEIEGEFRATFKLDLPDGEPLTADAGSLEPRGLRRSSPRWIAGPAAPPTPDDLDRAWIYPLSLSLEDAGRLWAAVARSFTATLLDGTAPVPAIRHEDGGPPMETIARVMVASPSREFEAISAISDWQQSRDRKELKRYWCSASVIDTSGLVLRRLTIPPGPDFETSRPTTGISPSVASAVADLGLVESDAGEVHLWHATDSTAATAIEASGKLRCDDNGVAYVSTSPEIAGLLRATGKTIDTLLKLRVPLALLDISKDWRPQEPRVDFHFLCGGFREGPISVVERRSASSG